MTGEEATGEPRACAACGESLPADRSVCPSCGTLQPVHHEPGDDPDGRYGPRRGPVPTSQEPPVVPQAAELHARRRMPRLAVVAVIGVVVCILGVAAGAAIVSRDGSDDGAATTTTAPGTDPRTAAIRGYCDDPRPLTRPAGIATFTPGQGAIAFVELPQPASSTEPPGEITVQVSPAIGSPDLELDPSVGLVSLAVCLDPSGSKRSGGRCDYERTNADAVGDRASAKLLETTYDVRLLELRTGKALVEGELTTAVDRCPDLAYLVEGEGVSNAVTEEQVLAWIGANLVDGQPT